MTQRPAPDHSAADELAEILGAKPGSDKFAAKVQRLAHLIGTRKPASGRTVVVDVLKRARTNPDHAVEQLGRVECRRSPEEESA